MYTPEKLHEHLTGLLINVTVESVRIRFARELKFARKQKKQIQYGDDLYKYVYSRTVKHILDL